MRRPEVLRPASKHALDTLSHLLGVSIYLEDAAADGRRVLTVPMDRAVLRAFCVCARMLKEFLVERCTGEGRTPRRDDVVAADWFPSGDWARLRRYRDLPLELRDLGRRTGKTIAHLTYSAPEADSSTAWWHHVDIAEHIAFKFACFANDVDPDLVEAGFRINAEETIIRWRARGEPTLLPESSVPVRMAG